MVKNTSKKKAKTKSKCSALLNLCCGCLVDDELTSPSDVVLTKYGEDVPYEYIVEKTVIKRVPVPLFALKEDLVEIGYDPKLMTSNAGESTSTEKASTNEQIAKFKTQVVNERLQRMKEIKHLKQNEPPKPKPILFENEVLTAFNEDMEERVIRILEPNDSVPLKAATAFCPPAPGSISGAMLPPDLEKTINSLKGVQPHSAGRGVRPKNQMKRPSKFTRGSEVKLAQNESLLAKVDLSNDLKYSIHSLRGKGNLNKTRSDTKVGTKHTVKLNVPMVDKETSNYEDAIVSARSSNIFYKFIEGNSSSRSTNEEEVESTGSSNEQMPPHRWTIPFGRKKVNELFFFKNQTQPLLEESPSPLIEENTDDMSYHCTDVSIENQKSVTITKESQEFVTKTIQGQSLKWRIIIKHHQDSRPTSSSSEGCVKAKKKLLTKKLRV